MMIFVPNMSKPTKRNSGYVAKVLILFEAKITCYGLRGYFARGINVRRDIKYATDTETNK